MAERINIQVADIGFGSYLNGILPEDTAVAAGAFSASMQQIRNLQETDIETLAQVVSTLETTQGLDSVNGTDKPTDQTQANNAWNVTALGSGPYGTYTMSDFFGAMTGLPYPWQSLQSQIRNLQTQHLHNVYRELFLAVTWEAAQVSVQYTSYQVESPPTVFTTYYHVTGVKVIQDGGGYGRGSAPAPVITINGGSGATAICTIGTDDRTAAPNGGGTFGRVTSATLTSSGTDTTTIPTVTIECPPVGLLPISSSGSINTTGSNSPPGTSGWSQPMNSVVLNYLNAQYQANWEIAAIKTRNPQKAKELNLTYDITGTQLTIEQRARFTGIPPVPTPRDHWLTLYPTSLYNFVDATPDLAQNTFPHMHAQSLEAISDYCDTGGQSIVAMMRQERNQSRLQLAGIDLDNNIPDEPSQGIQDLLLTNGTAPVARYGVPIGNSNYTIPAVNVNVTCEGDYIYSLPIGYLDPNTNKFIVTDSGTTNPETVGPLYELVNITNINLGPNLNGTGPALIISNDDANSLQTGVSQSGIDTLVGGLSTLPSGLRTPPAYTPITVIRTGASIPLGTNGTPLDTGNAVSPGSLGGSSASNVIPPNLNTNYTSMSILPSRYTVSQAIDEVIKCNCECWIQ